MVRFFSDLATNFTGGNEKKFTRRAHQTRFSGRERIRFRASDIPAVRLRRLSPRSASPTTHDSSNIRLVRQAKAGEDVLLAARPTLRRKTIQPGSGIT